MNVSVLHSLFPVVLLIAAGVIAARANWLRPDSVKDLSLLVFMLLTPALLFRTMGKVDLAHLDLRPIGAYFSATVLLFVLVVWQGRASRLAAARAISACFGNTVGIGIALVGLAYGEAALVTLVTIVSVHALILLTLTTVVFELADAREHGHQAGKPGLAQQVLLAVRSGLVNPSTTPTLLGLAFAQTGLVLPVALDTSLHYLGSAMGPLALILVGASLARTQVGAQWRPALSLTLLKNLLLPAMVAASAWAWGLRGLPLTVVVVAASMPIGANAFMFSQRYGVAQELVTAAVAMSTGVALLTVSLVMALTGMLL
ncbi:MAG: hypothetical protein RLZZ126_1593 [Pseudomonadota bacterium]|jgi:predicted permease